MVSVAPRLEVSARSNWSWRVSFWSFRRCASPVFTGAHPAPTTLTASCRFPAPIDGAVRALSGSVFACLQLATLGAFPISSGVVSRSKRRTFMPARANCDCAGKRPEEAVGCASYGVVAAAAAFSLASRRRSLGVRVKARCTRNDVVARESSRTSSSRIRCSIGCRQAGYATGHLLETGVRP